MRWLSILIIMGLVFLYVGETGEEIIVKGSGLSMLPTITDSDYVILKEVNLFTIIKVGDIIGFQSPYPDEEDRLIVHRIISKSNGLYYTKGDNEPQDDLPITKDKIKYKFIGFADESYSCSL